MANVEYPSSSTESFPEDSEGNESFEEVLIENDSGSTEILLIPRSGESDVYVSIAII